MKSKRTLTAALLTLIVFYFPPPRIASADDCHDLLIHDIHSTQKDVTTRLSYYSEITKDNFEERKKNIDTAGDYLGIISGSANYGEFNDKRTHEFEKYGFTYDQQDFSSYYDSTLPIERVRAYAQCQHRGFLAHVERVGKDFVDIQIEWHKGLGMPETVKFKPSFLDGGELKGDVPSQLNHAEQFTIAIKRDIGKDFRLNANVGGTTARVFVPRFIELPPPDKKSLAEQIRDGIDFQVSMNKLVKPIGSISKDMVLHGFYRTEGDAWEVWSAHHPARPNYHFIYGFPGDGISVSKQEGPVRPMDHKMSLWGGVFTFDEGGRVYHASQGKDAVGNLTITAPATK